MSASNVWTRSRAKMQRFPQVLAQCAEEVKESTCHWWGGHYGELQVFSFLQAAAYGRCVSATTTGSQELRKDLCVREFNALKECFVSAGKKSSR